MATPLKLPLIISYPLPSGKPDVKLAFMVLKAGLAVLGIGMTPEPDSGVCHGQTNTDNLCSPLAVCLNGVQFERVLRNNLASPTLA